MMKVGIGMGVALVGLGIYYLGKRRQLRNLKVIHVDTSRLQHISDRVLLENLFKMATATYEEMLMLEDS